jgi:hypothetical protein
MLNVGKPLRTPDDILVEIEDDGSETDKDSEVVFDVESGGLSPFEEQEKMLSELGVGRTIENEDGSITVEFGEDDEDKEDISGEFDQNLAEVLDESTLGHLALELVSKYDEDKNTRKEWEESLARGLKLLGMSVEQKNDPWANSCGVFHPVLLEAVTRGWAKSVKDLAPARGPAKADLKTFGKKGSTKRLRRVTQEVNCVIDNDVPGYSDEQSRLSFMTHLSGSGFKKVYFNKASEKIEDRYVHPLDLVMPYGTTDIDACPRICHRQDLFPTEVASMMDSGMWRKVNLPMAQTTQRSEPKEEMDAAEGRTPNAIPTTREILEFHVDLHIPEDAMNESGLAVPYLIVVDKTTTEVLNVRRNWIEGSKYKRRRYFVAYQYITGYSVYGIGMVHLIGGLAEGGTQILRQLVDAGTLSNLPAGFKSRGFRVRGDDKPLKPGEWRDVDFPGTRIEDAIMPLPFKEPSAVLAALLEKIVEEARRTASSVDAAIGDIGKEAPVGSVLAILEESLVIQNSVKIGMLRSLRRELEMIAEIMVEQYGAYRYVDDPEADFQADFAKPLKIIPASDANASSMAQRVVAYREAINTAQAAPPNTYDQKELHRSFLEAMEIPNAEKIVPLDEDIEPCDPVTENVKILSTSPVKVFDHQNHEAHIQVHMAAMNDPMIQQMIGQSPNAAAIQAAIASHIQEHIGYAYRQRIEQFYGQALPEPDRPLPAEIERAIAPQLAQAAQQVLQQSQQQHAAQEAQRIAEDPVIQIKKREVGVREREQERKAIELQAKLEREREKDALDATIRLIEIDGEMELEKKRLVLDALLQIKDMQKSVVIEREKERGRRQIAQQKSKEKPKPKSK